MSGHDGVRLPGTLVEGRLFQIEPQIGFPHFRIGAMTTETVAGQDRLHILVEVKMFARLGRGRNACAWQPRLLPAGPPRSPRRAPCGNARAWNANIIGAKWQVSVQSATLGGRTHNASLRSQQLSTMAFPSRERWTKTVDGFSVISLKASRALLSGCTRQLETLPSAADRQYAGIVLQTPIPAG